MKRSSLRFTTTVFLACTAAGVSGCSPYSPPQDPATVTLTATEISETSSPIDTVEAELQAAGISRKKQLRLSDVARATGYLPRGAGEEDARRFAYMALLECRDVVSGQHTWTEVAERAVATGALVEDALPMTQHLRHVFCSGVR